MAGTITTKVMIISDTHCFQFGDAEKVRGHFKQPLPKVDIILHCGDLTERGGLKAYQDAIRMLSCINAELKLVIAGNHDLSLDGPYWYTKGCDPEDPEDYAEHEKGIEILKGPLAKEAGVTYLEEGLHTFTLTSGAKCTVYASPYQPEFFPDFPGIDIMMTHGPPEDILDWVASPPGTTVGCQALLRAVSRARPLLHCFGHIHEAYSATVVTWKDDREKIGADAIEARSPQPSVYPDSSNRPIKFGKETMMVNAAIMDVNYNPRNSPWLVDLELPRAA
ncbi:Metallophosphoesterase domain-containing protein [Lachnellula hyalina]|uniref:Metallophosphoesterase domain-containing protein n=1 Tax=Lachnellula hyalina TaxID=1316788 RepID=A0A8H8QU82_9HELO|nr:Metallophosphoesterase domain-containing protein [Lachnellula hyalina]TVY22221.1 Metallophosphoesterase domain-containing protein [Lachnellula hyalina]